MPRNLSLAPTTNILPLNIDAIAQFKKSLEKDQKVYINLDLNKTVCENYDLKYFKLISYNVTENSIRSNIFRNNNNENIFFNKMLNENSQFDISNIQNNNDILLSDINLTNETSKNLIEKYSIKNTLSNIVFVDLQNQQSNLNINVNLYFKVSNVNSSEIYNFMIYCYNSKDEIIEKRIFTNLNLNSLSREKQADYTEIASILYNIQNSSNQSLFLIKSSLELDLLNRSISVALGNNLLIYRDNLEKIFTGVVLEETTSRNIKNYVNIDLNKFNLSEKLDITFRKTLSTNEIPKKYVLYCTLITGQIFTINLDIETLKIKKNNISFLEKIRNDILGIDTEIANEGGTKFLIIQIKVDDSFSNSDITNQYDPFISKIYINNIETSLDNFLLSSANFDFKLSNIRTAFIKYNMLRLDNLPYLSQFPVKVVFSNFKEGNLENVSFEKNVNIMQNTNIATLNKSFTNRNLLFSNQYTMEAYRYFFDVSNIFSINEANSFNSSVSATAATRYTNLNLDRILSDESKNILINDINVNNFYLIVKKNISFLNTNISLFELIDVNESNNNIYDFSFLDDSSFVNFNDNPIKYTDSVLQKEIEFETKIISLPLEYFSKTLNEYQVKLKIKEILKLNKNIDYVPLQSDIDLVYDRLTMLNSNSKGLNQIDIELLYNLFALNVTYAKSAKTLITKQNLINNITKNGTLKILTKQSSLTINNQNTLSFSFDVESSIEEKDNKVFEILQEALNAKIFSGFFYKEENNKYPDMQLDSLYKNKIPSMFYKWKSNSANGVIDEINNNYIIEISSTRKDLYKIKVKLNLNKCNNLYHFLTLIQNQKDKVSLVHNLSERLYQQIIFKDINKNYTDSSGNNVNLTIRIENKENQFIKYPVIPMI
jgi:hypothetical protein